MKRSVIFVFLSIISFYLISSEQVFEEALMLDNQGKFLESLQILEDSYQNNQNDIQHAWRIARTTFLISEYIEDKSERFTYYDRGVEVTKELLNTPYADKRDMAELIHWYAINYSSKIKEMGIFAGREGLKIIPKVFELVDQCIATDSEYAGGYFFKGKFYGEIPGFLGGNKVLMEANFVKTLQYISDEEIITMLYEISDSLKKRQWSLDKKRKEFEKSEIGEEKMLSNNQSDWELAEKLLNQLVTIYQKKEAPVFKDTEYYQKAVNLLAEIQKKNQK
ncbi:MAG: TRAP transporter TatT component family protein [Spirochaetes bacterium]|nr:TRAP transporter TatT component family protein [Spirochaetota bacterium]